MRHGGTRTKGQSSHALGLPRGSAGNAPRGPCALLLRWMTLTPHVVVRPRRVPVMLGCRVRHGPRQDTLVGERLMERAPKPKARSRRPPDLPRELTRQSDGAKLFHGEDLAISHVALRDTKLDAISSHHLQLDSAILERVALAGSRFASIHLRGVRFLGCDLANVETRALTAIRVEFVDCHMTGFRVTEGCQADDVLIA